LFLHVGQIGLDDERRLGLLDVDRGHEVREVRLPDLPGPFDEEPVQPIAQPLLHLVELDEGIPPCELHRTSCNRRGLFRSADRPAPRVRRQSPDSGDFAADAGSCRSHLQFPGKALLLRSSSTSCPPTATWISIAWPISRARTTSVSPTKRSCAGSIPTARSARCR